MAVFLLGFGALPQFAIIGYGVVGRALGSVLCRKVKDSVVRAYDNRPKSALRGYTLSLSIRAALKDAEHIFLCVPSHLNGKGVEGPYWRKLAKTVARHAEPDAVLVIKSTLIPGDARKLEKYFSRRIVVCPEFMSEGTAERDILSPHRVIVGGADKVAVNSVINIYRRWVPARRIIRMDVWSAQLAKLFANAMLAQRVSSINSIAAMCERGDGNAAEISSAVGRDPRIGGLYLSASAGFGGSCLEKDIRLLRELALCMGLREVARYWQSVIDMNDARVRQVINMVAKKAGRGGRVAIMGLAFKPGVADVRGSVAVRVATALESRGHPVVGHDPRISRVDGLNIASTPYASAKAARCIVVLNDEPEYRRIDWRRVARLAPDAKAIVVCDALASTISGALVTTVLGARLTP